MRNQTSHKSVSACAVSHRLSAAKSRAENSATAKDPNAEYDVVRTLYRKPRHSDKRETFGVTEQDLQLSLSGQCQSELFDCCLMTRLTHFSSQGLFLSDHSSLHQPQPLFFLSAAVFWIFISPFLNESFRI